MGGQIGDESPGDSERYLWQRRGSGTDPTASIRWDATFEALSDPMRRWVLEYLGFRGAPVSVPELSRYLARRDSETGTGAISARSIGRAEMRLYHAHLPKLQESDLITHDEQTEQVALTAEGALVLRLLSD